MAASVGSNRDRLGSGPTWNPTYGGQHISLSRSALSQDNIPLGMANISHVDIHLQGVKHVGGGGWSNEHICPFKAARGQASNWGPQSACSADTYADFSGRGGGGAKSALAV